MSADIFSPAWGSTQSVANAATATATAALPVQANALLLTNTSATARTHVLVTYYGSQSELATAVAGNTAVAPTTSGSVPVLPSSQVTIYYGRGPAAVRTIATAADGNILITPGVWL